MANTFAPFGFLQFQGGAGASPTFSQSTRRIAAGNSTAIYYGDPVMPVTGTANGYITQAAPGSLSATVPLVGVFVGCKYLSVAQKRTVWSRYWPGSDANGDVEAYVIDDPNVRFVVQSASTATTNSAQITGSLTTFTYSPVGQNCTYALGTGNTATGTSGAYLSAIGTTAAYPFTIVDLVTFPPGANGADPTSTGNWLVVGFNNEFLRSNAAVTGIS